MKRILLAFTGFVAALSLLWVGVVHGANVRSGDAPIVSSGEVIDGTLYTAGQTVKVAGTVEGDVFCAGMNVDISGTVEGDVLCAAQNITVSGHVLGDIRLAGQTVSVSGKVDGSATMAGMALETKTSAIIGRDLTAGGQSVVLDGKVNRDALVGSQTFASNATIFRNLDVSGDNITLQNGATVGGNFVYTSVNNATVSGAVITGTTSHNYPETQQKAQVNLAGMYAVSLAFSFLSFAVLGGVLLLVSPRLMVAAPDSIRKSPFATFGLGLVALFLIPIVSVALLITVIGVPLAFLLMACWFVGLMVSTVFTAKTIGDIIVEKLKWAEGAKSFLAIMLGLFILFLIGLIPVVGPIIMFVAVVWGMGALLYVIGKHRQNENLSSSGGLSKPREKKKVYL